MFRDALHGIRTMPAAVAWGDAVRMLRFWFIPDEVDTMPGQCPDTGVFADRDYVGEEHSMIAQTMRRGCDAALLLVVLLASTPAHAWCIWGFGQCAPSIVGEYALDGNSIARLTITADKITSSIGPVSFTADYVVKSFDGNRVTIEVGLPPDAKVPLDVQVEKDQLRIGTKHVLAGVWKRRAAVSSR